MNHPLSSGIEFVKALPILSDGTRRVSFGGCEVIFGFPIESYHKAENAENVYYSKTRLHAIMDPARGREWVYENHVKHPEWEESDEDRDVGASKEDHFKVGRAIDVLLFDGEEVFKAQFCETPEQYPNTPKPTKDNPFPEAVYKPWHAAATFCQEWEYAAKKSGFTILKRAQMEWVYRAYSSIMRNEKARAILTDPNWIPQVTFRWRDASGRLLQSRLDVVNFVTGEWCDLKTTRYFSRPAYGREFVVRAYHLQGFLGEEAFRKIGIPPRGGKHIICGKTEFPKVRVDDVPPQLIEAGSDLFEKCMDEYSRCEQTGIWYDHQDLSEESWIELPQFVSDILARRQESAGREIYTFDPDEVQ